MDCLKSRDLEKNEGGLKTSRNSQVVSDVYLYGLLKWVGGSLSILPLLRMNPARLPIAWPYGGERLGSGLASGSLNTRLWPIYSRYKT